LSRARQRHCSEPRVNDNGGPGPAVLPGPRTPDPGARALPVPAVAGPPTRHRGMRDQRRAAARLRTR
jgi:hypothetical protein